MVPVAQISGASPRRLRLPLYVRLAGRDFRGGIRGFFVFLASIALGVFAITCVGSVSLSLKEGLAREGRTILGGDVSFDVAQRELGEPGRAFLESNGRLTVVAQLRAMARNDNGDASLVEIKAIDEAYPLAKGPVLDPPLPLAGVLAERDGVFGMAADPALLGRLGLHAGERVKIGAAEFQIRAELVFEPDRLASSVRFGPPGLISAKGLEATGLVQPGSLIKRHYRLVLPGDPPTDAQIDALITEAKVKFPEAGFDVRTRKNISPQFTRNVDRFTEFLTLVGLTALISGGVGVANAITGFVARKRTTIATLKALGATGSEVFAIMLTQAMLVAAAGAAAGAALGAALPFAVTPSLGALISFPVAPAIYPTAIAKGLAYGLLTALAFSAVPLGCAHDIPVQALFRGQVEERQTRPRLRYLLLVCAAGLCLFLAVFFSAADRNLVWIYTGATLAAIALLRGAAFLLTAGAKKLPHARSVSLRLAISSFYRPGTLTPSAMLSLGLGLALLVALALIDGNLRAELRQPSAGKTPSFFFLDVPSVQAGEFLQFLQREAPGGAAELVPMLRGRIIRLNGASVEAFHPKPGVAWVLEGDRGITFADSVPEGSSLAGGAWWPKGYQGPDLVSFESEIAERLGLKIGDEVTVNVLGREVTARIASTRRVNWLTFGINFVMVFSPNSFAGAPYNDLATLTFAAGSDSLRETALVRALSARFPQVAALRVKDALDALNGVIDKLAIAVRAASSVAFAASILVLAGAVAAGQNARIHDAAVLKTLGATRGRLIAAYVLEYGLIGAASAFFGLAAGTAAAYAIVRGVMDLEFQWLWPQALAAAAVVAILTVFLGLAGSWRILGRKPAPYLREL